MLISPKHCFFLLSFLHSGLGRTHFYICAATIKISHIKLPQNNKCEKERHKIDKRCTLYTFSWAHRMRKLFNVHKRGEVKAPKRGWKREETCKKSMTSRGMEITFCWVITADIICDVVITCKTKGKSTDKTRIQSEVST